MAWGTELATSPLMCGLEEELSAIRVLSRPQAVLLGIVVVALSAALAIAPLLTLLALATLWFAFCIATSSHQAYVAVATVTGGVSPPAPPLADDELPPYTVIVPLYQEAAVVEGLVCALTALDYPTHLLDVKLLVETHDPETIEALEALELGPQFEILRLPPGQPQTKPRACNHGLERAEGDLVVIFDAEDRPEPDQLRKAAAALAAVPADVACVQAKLDFWNPTTNFTTRYSASEFCQGWRVFRPGLERLGAPIPLGGTSNHFPVRLLRELGAWDRFNVTEDADLGMRLARAGYRTHIIESTTYEEANSQVHNWVRQRSRWIKGWIQTWLVHTRHPIRLHRELGTRATIHFHITLLSGLIPVLIGPLAWALSALLALALAGAVSGVLPTWLLVLGVGSWAISLTVAVSTHVTGLRRGRYQHLLLGAVLVPVYELLKSVAAAKAVWQLITRPHYWEKTIHGLEPEPSLIRPNPVAAESRA